MPKLSPAPTRVQVVIAAILTVVTLLACENRRSSGSNSVNDSVAAKKRATSQVLLFNGTGTSLNDVRAVEAVLDSNALKYSTADSAELNQMSESQLREYRLLIVPGGNFIEMASSLSSQSTANIRNAVHNGLNYLGICAGGFLAGDSSHYNGINLTSGVRFGFYSVENRGIRKAAVPLASADGSVLEQYWEDGPQFSGWGAVVAKYPDGTPAIVEGSSGKGRVILVGVHPEAPESWRAGMSFRTPAASDNAYAGLLIQAAANGASLPHY